MSKFEALALVGPIQVKVVIISERRMNVNLNLDETSKCQLVVVYLPSKCCLIASCRLHEYSYCFWHNLLYLMIQ